MSPFFTALSLSSISSAAVLDPEAAPTDRILEAAVQEGGIDLRRSWESSAAAEAPLHLAPLDGRSHGGKATSLGMGWVDAVADGRLRMLAAYLPNQSVHPEDFGAGWTLAEPGERLVVTHGADSTVSAQRLRERLFRAGYVTHPFGGRKTGVAAFEPAAAGALYAEAGSRWALVDSESAESEVWMASSLLASLPAGSAFPFHRNAQNRGSSVPVNSRLELNAAFLPVRARELIGVTSSLLSIPGRATTAPRLRSVPGAHVSHFPRLPGGVVLGQLAVLDGDVPRSAPRLDGTATDARVTIDGTSWHVAGLDRASRAACASFVSSSGDEAAVDINRIYRDHERLSGVYVHPALRGSAIGEALVWSDHMPYAYLGSQMSGRTDRSVLVDRSIRLHTADDQRLTIEVDFDVRFYRRGVGDEAAIVDARSYTASSADGFRPAAYIDAPGPTGTRRLVVADAQDHGLSTDLAPFARAAAWVSLSRWVVASGGEISVD